MQKRFTTAKGKEITVKVEKNRYYVKHTDISPKFVTADVALNNWIMTREEKEFINKALEEL